MSLLEARQVSHAYAKTPALENASITIEPGAQLAIMGPSGSGKSTLLHCLAGIISPRAGEVFFDRTRLNSLSEAQRSRIRLVRIGMVFQFGDLVPELTLIENVMLPLQVLGTKRAAARARAGDLLDRLGVAPVADRRAGAVSGGQAQRAAVARALAHEPLVVLADEPTGALDSLTAESVLDTMIAITQEIGAALVVVTHDNVVASHLSDLVVLRDGRVQAEVPV